MISKDLTRAILFAVIVFVLHSWVGQLPQLIMRIPGIGYYLIIVHTFVYGVAALMFEGRRWRLVFMTALILVLTLPLSIGGPPYDIISRLPVITSAFFLDVIFNSIYKKFKMRNWLLYWVISAVTFHFMLSVLLTLPINMLFYTPDVVERLFQVTFIFLPVVFIESIIGGYVGYQIYRKVEHVR